MSKRTQEQVACEILTTGFCPFNCEYCYIPKTEHMKTLHKQIEEGLKNGTYIKQLKTFFGSGLEFLGFWGTEPTLTTDLLIPKLPELFKEFPNLHEFSYSSGQMTDPEIQVRFVKAVVEAAPRNKEIRIGIQSSTDGPAWITDTNRQKGIADRIPKQIKAIVEGLNDVDLRNVKVEFRWKATHSPDNMRAILEKPERLDEYYEYFMMLNKTFHDANKNKNVTLAEGSYVPTLMVPGKYTVEDGKLFARYIKTFHDRGYDTTYTFRLLRLFEFYKELGYKRRMFSCSGGKSNFGLGGDSIHICHRTFYYNNQEYIDSILQQSEIDNWDVSLFKSGSIANIQKNYIIDPNDKDEVSRYLHTLAGYHDFWRLQIGYIITALKELAYAGQVGEIYLENDDVCLMFALFMNSGLSCPMENLLNTGSIHLQVLSLIKLFGNGAFEEILSRAIKMKLGKAKEKKINDSRCV